MMNIVKTLGLMKQFRHRKRGCFLTQLSASGGKQSRIFCRKCVFFFDVSVWVIGMELSLSLRLFGGKCLNRKINLPSPDDYGWEWNDRPQLWMPFWTTLKDVSSACSMLLHCSCKKACRGNCKCFKHSLRCTPLCRCEGGCSNTLES